MAPCDSDVVEFCLCLKPTPTRLLNTGGCIPSSFRATHHQKPHPHTQPHTHTHTEVTEQLHTWQRAVRNANVTCMARMECPPISKKSSSMEISPSGGLAWMQPKREHITAHTSDTHTDTHRHKGAQKQKCRDEGCIPRNFLNVSKMMPSTSVSSRSSTCFVETGWQFGQRSVSTCITPHKRHQWCCIFMPGWCACVCVLFV